MADMNFTSMHKIQLNNISYLSKLAEDTRVSIEILNYAIKRNSNMCDLRRIFLIEEVRSSYVLAHLDILHTELYTDISFGRCNKVSKDIVSCIELFTDFSNGEDKSLSIDNVEKINSEINIKRKGYRRSPMVCKPDFYYNSIFTDYDQLNYDGIKRALFEILGYMYNDTEVYHPLIKLALVHYQFYQLHPFYNYNDITARIINNLVLTDKHYLDEPVFCPSIFLLKYKDQYEKFLSDNLYDKGFDKWVEFMLQIFNQTAIYMTSIIDEVNKLLSKYKQDDFLVEFSVNKDNRELLRSMMRMLFEVGYVSNVNMQETRAVNRQTAAVYLDKLADMGILEKHKVGRENLYKNVKLFELFDEVNNG